MLACYIGMPSLWLSPGAIAHAGPFSWLHHTELRWPELYDEPWGPLRTHTHTHLQTSHPTPAGPFARASAVPAPCLDLTS